MNVLNKLVFPFLSPEKKKDMIVNVVENLSDGSGRLRFFKDKDTGSLRWITAWSSNYLDDDYPPDVICEKAHKDFVERVDKGIVPYPELWHWHTKNTTWGKSDWLAYDDDYGIMWASGLVDDGHEKEALALMESDIEIGVSHGMKDVIHDPHDLKSITQYNTYEISDLPLRWAANKMTAMFIAESKNSDLEGSMSLKDEKKEYLKKVGLSDEQVADLDAFGKEQSDKFADRIRKEADEQEIDEKKDETALESDKASGDNGEEPETPEATGEEETEPIVDDSAVETKASDTDTILKAVKESFDAFGDVVLEKFTAMEARIKALESLEKQRVEKEVEKSLEPLSASILEKFRAIGSADTVVKEGDALAKDKPAEEPFDNKAIKNGSDFLTGIVTNAFGIKTE